jgi:hypothetical protein
LSDQLQSQPLHPDLATQIKTAAFSNLPANLAGKSHLAVAPTVLAEGQVLNLVDRQIEVQRASVLVFVDHLPRANWGHACEYQFYDPTTGSLVQQASALFPPHINHPTLALEVFHAPLATAATASPVVFQKTNLASILGVDHLVLGPNEDRYAVLWTSQISNRRHVEDLEFLWRTLVDIYGFKTDHIYVLCYDGTINATDTGGSIGNWVGDNTPYRMTVHSAATAADLTAVFSTLAGKLQANDLLLVHTNNHGSPSGLCVDGGSVITPDQFGAMLATLPTFESLVVTMEQCFSGAFQGPVIAKSTAAKTVFASAVSADKSSDGDAHFDPWAYAWIGAIAGATPYGAALAADPDTNHDGLMSMKEACNYALANDTGADDNPQYADNPAGCGTSIFLGLPPSPSLVATIEKFLAGIAVQPIPGPDPGPERQVTTVSLQSLSAVAKAISRFPAPSTTGLIRER